MTSGTALFVLIEAIFNSQAYADVLPPLYIYDLQGNYTEEMLAVYYG
jgi:tRNA1(Val) A37 N6-methylase TrmN6